MLFTDQTRRLTSCLFLRCIPAFVPIKSCFGKNSSDFGDIRRGWLRSLFKMAIDASAAGALAM